jgi:hypothetical protein
VRRSLRAFAAYLEHASAWSTVVTITRWMLVLGVMVVGVRVVASVVLYPVYRMPLAPLFELIVLAGFGVAGLLLSLLAVGVLGLANKRAPELERLPAPESGPGPEDLPKAPAEAVQNPAIMFGLGPDVPR